MNYDVKINNVCDYIQSHLDDELDLDLLCSMSHLSKYHFHRIFRVYTGITLIRYVYLCRLKRASYQLAWANQIKIIDIALNAGFDSPEAFTRAFKKLFSQTPSAFRKSPDWQYWHEQLNYKLPKRELDMQVDIISRQAEKIAYIRHRGSPAHVNQTAQKFIQWRKQTGLSPITTSHTYGIPYSDPDLVDGHLFEFDIAGSIKQDLMDNQTDIQQAELPAGEYALIRHYGSHDQLSDCIYYLYRQWLNEHQREAGDFPIYFQYHNFSDQVNESELITDVLLLLKS